MDLQPVVAPVSRITPTHRLHPEQPCYRCGRQGRLPGLSYCRDCNNARKRADNRARRSSSSAHLCTDGTVFVRVARGLYIKTHPAVVAAACSYCGAPRGAACVGVRGHPMAGTHLARRKAATLE